VNPSGETSNRVFVSYSSGDHAAAEAIVAMLEAGGVPCWIAPRNIAKGAVWPKAIAAAVADCRLFLVVFSAAADGSANVLNELTLAGGASKTILPVRIRNDRPVKLKYFLDSLQWFDAFEHPLAVYASALCEAVQGQTDGLAVAATAEPDNSAPSAVRALPRRAPITLPRARLYRLMLVAVIAISMTLGLQLFFYLEGQPLLQGASFWFVLGVCGIIAWCSAYVWTRLKHTKEGS
jgi:hypothetical protein